jgi:serine/threonine-protein kinase
MLQGFIDKYKLIETKGSGTFGTVWLAEDTWMGKQVALKIPHNQKEDFTRLIAEPKLLATLTHPNIVQILTVDKAENIFFMVMEYVDGQSLAQLMQDATLTVREVVDIVSQILSGVQYAHEKNVIHRDLKPGNILLTHDRKVKISDFGTATMAQAVKGPGIGGTLYYMAKEQVLGHPVPASDIYSVGVVLYEMVTGQLPFIDEVAMVLLNKILKDDPMPPRKINPNIPPRLEAIILKALQKEVSKRYQSAAEMKADLESLPAELLDKPVTQTTASEALPAGTLVQDSQKPSTKEVPDINQYRYRGYTYRMVRTLGGRGKEEGQFMQPVAVAVDAKKRVYVVDSLKCNIQVFDHEGKYLYSLGKFGREAASPEEICFLNPVSLAVDQAGNVVALDAKLCTVQIIDKAGHVIAKFGEPASPESGKMELGMGGFSHPQSLALDTNDNIFVADTGNNRIRVFNPAGKIINKFGNHGARLGEFNGPSDLKMDNAGNLLVLDEKNFRVQMFTPRGVFKNKFGKRGTGRGEFSSPWGLATDSKRNVFVTDRNLRVQVFDPEGYYITEFGTPVGNYAIAPRYWGITIDDDNTVYLTDVGNCTVLVYELKKV